MATRLLKGAARWLIRSMVDIVRGLRAAGATPRDRRRTIAWLMACAGVGWLVPLHPWSVPVGVTLLMFAAAVWLTAR